MSLVWLGEVPAARLDLRFGISTGIIGPLLLDEVTIAGHLFGIRTAAICFIFIESRLAAFALPKTLLLVA